MKTARRKLYEKRHNTWRCNVPKSVRSGARMPKNFILCVGQKSFRKVFRHIWKKTKPYFSNPTYIKSSWFSRLITFIKRLRGESRFK